MAVFTFVRIIGRRSTPNHATVFAPCLDSARELAVAKLGTDNIRQHIPYKAQPSKPN